MLVSSKNGLYCPSGDFYIDPTGPVEKAVVTHGHADHAIPGSDEYWAHSATCKVMEARWEKNKSRKNHLDYDESVEFGSVSVSLHPAGHILGSSQIKISNGDETWVVSGDYNRGEDPTCKPFSVQKCDVFISESTFGLPVFQWPSFKQVCREIILWAEREWENGKTTVLYGYSLGKTQRVLAGLAAAGAKNFVVHSSANKICNLYRGFGIEIPEFEVFNKEMRGEDLVGRFVMLPPVMERSHFINKSKNISAAFLSGWMQLRGMRRRRAVDKGFVLSDHADWGSLISTIEQTQASKVYTTHGYSDVLARYVNENLKVDASELKVLRDRVDDQ